MMRSCLHRVSLLNTGLGWVALAYCLNHPGWGKLAVFDSMHRGQGQGLGTTVIPLVNVHCHP